MVTRSLALISAVLAGAAAQEGYCPPVMELESDWPMSRILKDVCRRDDEVDCSGIPGLLDVLAEMASEPADANKFRQAKSAAGFLCDSCLDSIRDGVTYLGDAHPATQITGAGAMKATCSGAAGCMDKWKAIATKFSETGAVAKYNKLEADCGSGASAGTIARDIEDFMHTINDSLESVRDVADQLMFEKAEGPAARGASARGGARSPLRIAAYGCLALGTALLVAAAVVRGRRPTAEEGVQETELL